MYAWLCVIFLSFWLIILADIGLRALGVGNFALFERGGPSYYKMASNQKGRFRRSFNWLYDQRGMRTNVDIDSLRGHVILLGDSVVDGGNALDQSQTLAALLTKVSGQIVYPVACHGWALGNELEALAEMPEWQEARQLIWIVNTGDFDDLCKGGSEYSFPTRRPFWLLLWLIRRYLYRTNPIWWPWRRPEVVAVERSDLRTAAVARFAEVAAQFSGEIILLRYPMCGPNVTREGFYDVLAGVKPGIRQITIGHTSDWGCNCYMDHIHPNAYGVELIAEEIAPLIGKI